MVHLLSCMLLGRLPARSAYAVALAPSLKLLSREYLLLSHSALPQSACQSGMQVEVPQRPQHCQESSATLQQLRTTANSLQHKLQDAMQQAMRSGATRSSANQSVPDLMPKPTLRRLQHHIMSTQTAPCDGIRNHAESSQHLMLRSSQHYLSTMSAM